MHPRRCAFSLCRRSAHPRLACCHHDLGRHDRLAAVSTGGALLPAMAPPAPVPAALRAPLKDPQAARIVSLIGAAVVALSAGSNYAFSSFAPQMQENLHLTSTQINLIGLFGNMGVYLSGPVWGTWVDQHGPRLALCLAACLVAIGYGGLSYFAPGSLHQDNGASSLQDSPSSVSATFVVPLLFALSTGVANSGALAASMNAQAKSWGGNRRGTATGIVLAGFGLSAAFYSTISSTFFADDPRNYLRCIATISFLAFVSGTFVIRINPPVHHHHHHHHHRPHLGHSQHGIQGDRPLPERVRTLSSAQSRSRSRSLSRPYTRRRTTSEVSAMPWSGVSAASATGSSSESDEETSAAPAHDVEAVGGYGAVGDRPAGHALPASHTAHTLPRGEHLPPPQALDISGWNLLRDYDFWLLFALMAIVSGAGLLLINNVGTITRTLYRSGLKHPKAQVLRAETETDWAVPLAEDAVAALTGAFVPLNKSRKSKRAAEVHRLQAQQVSAISLGNAIGRIAIGILADLAVSLAGGQEEIRVWLLAPVCVMAVASQAFAAYPGAVGTVPALLVLSISTGLMYGTLFGICPSLNLEFFGLANFSANWGILSLAPVVAGNTFNLIFGAVFDSHVRQSPGAHECLQGEECYRTTFVITAYCAIAACGLAAALIWRRGRLTSSHT